MAVLAAKPTGSPIQLPVDDRYEPGRCNIGPAEIARRRRTGMVGTIATVIVLAILVLVQAPAPLRAIVFVPAAVATSGYLQARLRFCAGFGWLGVFNFGDVGTTDHVASAGDRARDRATAARIGIASGVVGLVAALVACLLPV